MKLLSYAPDIDPITDGILIDCNQVIPTVRGIASAPRPVAVDLTAQAASAVIGAATLTKINGDQRVFYGSDTRLYELVSSAWSNKSGSTAYTPITTGRWRFVQYGDVSLAIAKQNTLRGSSSGDFTAVITATTGTTVTAPSASVIEVVNDFIFLGDTTGIPGFTADTGDRWICSARGDYQNYTPSISTECVTGRLTSISGKITAIKKFGDQVVIYKERGMYLGSNVGPPVVWQFPEVPTAGQGTWCQESVISLATPEQPLHFFVGRDDFYLFDGARPIPVGHGVKEAFFSALNTEEADNIILLQNREKSLVYVYYPSSGNSTIDSCLVFNYRTKKWGVDNRTINYAFEYSGGAIAYSGVGAYLSNLLAATATYGGLASLNLTYGSFTTRSANMIPAIFDSSNVLYTLTGDGANAQFTPGDYGTEDYHSKILRVNPRWIVHPTDASMDNYYWGGSGETPVFDTTTQMEAGRFDLIRSSGWHRFTFYLSGSWELNEAKVIAVPDGDE